MATYKNGVLVPVAPAAHESTHVSGGSDDIDSALAGAAVPSLAASKITSGRFPVDRLPALTDEYIWKGTGANVEEIAVPTGAPSGVIAMWHGLIANIPAGWVICDGNSSTPNLLTKFVEGVATALTEAGAGGGATAKTTTGHQHNLTEEEEVSGGSTGNYTKVSPAVSATDSIPDIRPLYYDIIFLMKT